MKTFLQAVLGAIALLLTTQPAEARKIVSQLPAESFDRHSSTAGRQLLQYGYYNNCDYYGNCGYNWSGGRIAGVVIGCVAFVCGIVFLILSILMRRRRLAAYQNNAGAYPVGLPVGGYPNQGLQGPTGGYPQANTYPNQAYPSNQGYPQTTGGYNPAQAPGYNPAPAYPVTGTPASGYNGVQMQPLPQEKPGYQTSV
ncbi:TPA: hypothetical protein ACH3X2_003807 [Trebouxia sp. C0005]|nr:MAG: hypothetical protein FRX49_12704 [Trebouxia sp. A1-2]